MFGLRLRLMGLLDHVLHRDANVVQTRLVQEDDAARDKRVGPQEGAIENLRRAVGS